MKDGSSCHAAYTIVIGSERLCAWQLRPETAFQFQSAGWWFSNRAAVDAIANLDEARVRHMVTEKHLREEEEERQATRRAEEALLQEQLAAQNAANARRAEEVRRSESLAIAVAEAETILANVQEQAALISQGRGTSSMLGVGPSASAELALGRVLRDQARASLKDAEQELAERGFALVSEERDDDEGIVLTWRG